MRNGRALTIHDYTLLNYDKQLLTHVKAHITDPLQFESSAQNSIWLVAMRKNVTNHILYNIIVSSKYFIVQHTVQYCNGRIIIPKQAMLGIPKVFLIFLPNDMYDTWHIRVRICIYETYYIIRNVTKFTCDTLNIWEKFWDNF